MSRLRSWALATAGASASAVVLAASAADRLAGLGLLLKWMW